MEEIDIWRAAKKMLEIYPEGDASLAAAMRADKAFEQDDKFNFELWKRIARAVSELEKTKPSADDLRH